MPVLLLGAAYIGAKGDRFKRWAATETGGRMNRPPAIEPKLWKRYILKDARA
jgi:hypothetical protein